MHCIDQGMLYDTCGVFVHMLFTIYYIFIHTVYSSLHTLYPDILYRIYTKHVCILSIYYNTTVYTVDIYYLLPTIYYTLYSIHYIYSTPTYTQASYESYEKLIESKRLELTQLVDSIATLKDTYKKTSSTTGTGAKKGKKSIPETGTTKKSGSSTSKITGSGTGNKKPVNKRISEEKVLKSKSTPITTNKATTTGTISKYITSYVSYENVTSVAVRVFENRAVLLFGLASAGIYLYGDYLSV